jgi:hypothetical protein
LYSEVITSLWFTPKAWLYCDFAPNLSLHCNFTPKSSLHCNCSPKSSLHCDCTPKSSLHCNCSPSHHITITTPTVRLITSSFLLFSLCDVCVCLSVCVELRAMLCLPFIHRMAGEWIRSVGEIITESFEMDVLEGKPHCHLPTTNLTRTVLGLETGPQLWETDDKQLDPCHGLLADNIRFKLRGKKVKKCDILEFRGGGYKDTTWGDVTSRGLVSSSCNFL